MRLEPFISVDARSFSMSREELQRQLGVPLRQRRNEVGLHEFDYGELIFRFQDSGRLEEVTAQSPVLHLGPIAVPFASLAAFVSAHDPQAFRRAGFTVSPAFGLA